MNKELLLTLVDSVIKVDRGGPNSRVGRLMAVGEDYFALLTKEDGIVYFKTHHIKNVTVDEKRGLNQDFEVPENLEYPKGEDFRSVIQHFKNQWVKVNRGGPEKLEGILNEVDEDYITVFSKDEVVKHSMFHIRNLSYDQKKIRNKGKEENQQKNISRKNNRSRKRG